jgi:hypothetical protein
VSNQLCRFLWKQTGTETAATCSDWRHQSAASQQPLPTTHKLG